MKGTMEFYDKVATNWSQKWFEEKKSQGIAKRFYNMFSDAGNYHPEILDFGCGMGYDVKILSELGAYAIGIDFSEKTIDIAKKNVKNAKFFVGDVTERFDKLGRFEGIMCLDTLAYVNIMKMREVFKNFARGLFSGGLLLVSISGEIGKVPEKSFAEIDGEIYEKNYTGYTIEQLCEFAYPNFKLVDSFANEEFGEKMKYFVFMRN